MTARTRPLTHSDWSRTSIEHWTGSTSRLQHGDGEVAWVLLKDAVRRGLDTRIGLEDTLSGPNGERTTGNEALVRAARELGAGTD